MVCAFHLRPSKRFALPRDSSPEFWKTLSTGIVSDFPNSDHVAKFGLSVQDAGLVRMISFSCVHISMPTMLSCFVLNHDAYVNTVTI